MDMLPTPPGGALKMYDILMLCIKNASKDREFNAMLMHALKLLILIQIWCTLIFGPMRFNVL